MNHAIIQLTNHGHRQYENRVSPIDKDLLAEECQKLYDEGDYDYRPRRMIKHGRVWWIYRRKNQRLYLVTCYGCSELDMPEALMWARRNRDRINLKHTL